jgi:hypothetical protein
MLCEKKSSELALALSLEYIELNKFRSNKSFPPPAKALDDGH